MLVRNLRHEVEDEIVDDASHQPNCRDAHQGEAGSPFERWLLDETSDQGNVCENTGEAR